MTTLKILAIIGLFALAAPAHADTMPFFGANPYDGSYWNGPGHKYQPEGYQSACSAFNAMARGARRGHWSHPAHTPPQAR
jgi:hypothetical protein